MNETLMKVKNFLETSGYEIENIEPEVSDNASPRSGFFVAKKQGSYTVVFLNLNDRFILLKVNLTTEKVIDDKMYEFVNKANRQFLVSRLYIDIEDGFVVLRIEAIFPAVYDEAAFSNFFMAYQKEQTEILRKVERFSELFLCGDHGTKTS